MTHAIPLSVNCLDALVLYAGGARLEPTSSYRLRERKESKRRRWRRGKAFLLISRASVKRWRSIILWVSRLVQTILCHRPRHLTCSQLHTVPNFTFYNSDHTILCDRASSKQNHLLHCIKHNVHLPSLSTPGAASSSARSEKINGEIRRPKIDLVALRYKHKNELSLSLFLDLNPTPWYPGESDPTTL